jgi:hypothetical protein
VMRTTGTEMKEYGPLRLVALVFAPEPKITGQISRSVGGRTMVAKLTGQTSALSSGTRLEQDEHTRPHLTQLKQSIGCKPHENSRGQST